MIAGVHERQILRLKRDQLWPRGERMAPDFMVKRTPIMDKTTPVASIGSCFAANVKGFLVRNGFNYLQTSTAPGSQIGSAAWGTVYNTACIAQEFGRAHNEFQPVERFWAQNGKLASPYRKGIIWKDCAHMEREVEAHKKAVRQALKRARVFIITAGLVEIWFSRQDGSVFFQVPPAQIFDPDFHSFAAASVTANVDNLQLALDRLWALNPDCKVILTVSPVPLRATFRPLNVVTANTDSKARLLLAAQEVTARDGRVHYFPSYELVTAIIPRAFKPDNRHVRPEILRQIMRIFLRSFVR